MFTLHLVCWLPKSSVGGQREAKTDGVLASTELCLEQFQGRQDALRLGAPRRTVKGSTKCIGVND